MRHYVDNRGPRLARSRVWLGATALLAFLAVATGCSSDPAPASAPSVGAPSSVVASGVWAAPLAKSPPTRVQIPAIGDDNIIVFADLVETHTAPSA